MASRALLLVLAFALSLIAALPASAKDEACTDVVDCLCDDEAAPAPASLSGGSARGGRF